MLLSLACHQRILLLQVSILAAFKRIEIRFSKLILNIGIKSENLETCVLFCKKLVKLMLIMIEIHFSKKFSEAQSMYSTTRREALALLWAVQKFKHLMVGNTVVLEFIYAPL
jgi:hypothetical protein